MPRKPLSIYDYDAFADTTDLDSAEFTRKVWSQPTCVERRPPYPNCHQPASCTLRGWCQRDPTCAD